MPTILAKNQVDAYLNDAYSTANPPLYALYVLCLGNGLRLGEALALREEDVDVSREVLRIERTLIRAGRTPVYGPPKSEKGRREVPLVKEAIAAIKRAMLWKKERRLRFGLRFRDAGLVICGRMGRPLNPSNIRNRDHGLRLKRLKLSHVRVRIHDMRHTRGTHWYAQGIDIRTISDLLGHASPSFTLATYVQATSEAHRRAADLGNNLVTRNGVSTQ